MKLRNLPGQGTGSHMLHLRYPTVPQGAKTLGIATENQGNATKQMNTQALQTNKNLENKKQAVV